MTVLGRGGHRGVSSFYTDARAWRGKGLSAIQGRMPFTELHHAWERTEGNRKDDWSVLWLWHTGITESLKNKGLAIQYATPLKSD